MSYKFDGTGDRLDANYGATLMALEGNYEFPVTIAAYIKWVTHPLTTQAAVSIGSVASTSRTNCFEIGTAATDNQIRCIGFDGSGVSTNRISTVSVGTGKDNAWIPVVAVISGTGTTVSDVTVYAVDYATSDSTFSSGFTLGAGTGIHSLRIGMSLNTGSNFGAANPNESNIAEVAMWGKALSQTEIEDYMDGSVNPSQIAPTDLKFYYALVSDTTQTAGSDGVGTLDVTNAVSAGAGNHPTIAAATTKFLKLLAHPSAVGATGVAGVVFSAPSGSDLTGSTRYGEFTGKSFESSTEGGYAVLKVPVADFGGGALTISDAPVASIRFTQNGVIRTTGIGPCTVIVE